MLTILITVTVPNAAVLIEDVVRDGGPDGGPDGEPGGLDILGFDHNKSTPKCLKPAVPSVDGEKLDFKST